jgi:hypothetical protein
MKIMYDAPQTVGESLAPKGITVREDQSFPSFEFALFVCLYEGCCALLACGVAVAGIVR